MTIAGFPLSRNGRNRRHAEKAFVRLLLLVCLAAWLLPTAVGTAASPKRKAISVVAPPELLDNSITATTITDVLGLLRQGFPGFRVALNDHAASVQIVLPRVSSSPSSVPRFARGRPYPWLAYPDHDYRWRSSVKDDTVRLTLTASSPQGVSFALYGLLQEKLGYRFCHPKQTIIPAHRRWPLTARFDWEATPRFDKKGFHLHTLHPIELAEQLHDPDFPHALADVKEYVDWLVRNQQNVLQFYLLRDIDRARWIDHARGIVDYAHRRGVLAGVEISVAMLQQQAFQAVKLLRPYPSYRGQIDRTLAWLFRAPWDFVTVEPTMGEYIPDLAGVMPDLTDYLLRGIAERYHARPLLATHVIRGKGFLGRASADPSGAGGTAGLLLHSVMCYSVTEPKAPVYGNVNQRFVLERAEKEAHRREIWYWPESAYWVAFDNSVPLFLLPYLDARWRDMAAMERAGVANHLTFSSGWEWGYWLTDWSIAHWSWRYRENGRAVRTTPLDRLNDLFPGQRMERLWEKALRLQNYYLKERELLRYMAAETPFAELPRSVSRPFQPEPDFRYSRLVHAASAVEVERILRGPVAELDAYADKMEALLGELEGETRRLPADNREGAGPKLLAGELTRALEVTALRARHRALTIKALTACRKQRPASLGDPKALLAAASEVRTRARQLVLQQEAIYRYPPQLIARKRDGHTAYRFGYLYPASDLFFWRREEEQARSGRFDPFFMNIWDFWRTIGLASLVF